MASDRDRLAAARYQAYKLHRRMDGRKRKGWTHWLRLPSAAVESERAQ